MRLIKKKNKLNFVFLNWFFVALSSNLILLIVFTNQNNHPHFIHNLSHLINLQMQPKHTILYLIINTTLDVVYFIGSWH